MANEFKVRKGLVINGSGSVLLDIQGSQGQLFSVTDQLSGSLFSVSDISGIPVMEAFSDNTIKIGKYGSEAIKVSGSVASVSGSFTGSFSGSLFGTASQALTASYLLGGVSGIVFPYSGSAQITGSLGVTGSLNVTLGITGSLFGTASWASASTSPIAAGGTTQTSLYSTQPAAGVPTGIADSIFFGREAGLTTSTAYNSVFLGYQAGYVATNANNSVFIGTQAGHTGTNVNNSVFIGAQAGFQSTTASYSVLLGYRAGYDSAGGFNGITSNNIIIGTNITLPSLAKDSINIGGLIFGTGSYSTTSGTPSSAAANGRIGINKVSPTTTLDISGSTLITGSLNVSQGITGSLFGTSSQALTASYLLGGGGVVTFPYSGSAQITGSLGITGSLNVTLGITGSLFGTASQAVSASYASYAAGGSASAILYQTASAAFTWSFNHFLQTQYPVFAIYDSGNNVIIPQRIQAVDTSSALIYFSSPTTGVAVASKGGYSSSVVISATIANTAISASFASSGTGTFSGSFSGSFSGVYTGSLFGTASQAVSASYAYTASSAVNSSASLIAVSASYALTASYVLGGGSGVGFPFTGSAQITGSLGVTGSINSTGNITTTGTLTAQTLVVQTITSSITYSSGSNIFGNSTANTQTMTGSLNVSGSATIIGRVTATDLTGSLFGTSSQAVSSSYSTTSSVAYSGTGSFTGSFTGVYTGSLFGTASQALTASYLLGGGGVVTFPYSGSAQITGSLGVSGSVNITSGSLTLVTGSLTLTSASLTYQQNLSVAAGGYQVIASAATASYRAAFFDYVMFSGSIVRGGTVTSTWSGSSTEYYENYTADLGGSTSGVTLQTALSTGNIQLQASASTAAWTIRSLIRLL